MKLDYGSFNTSYDKISYVIETSSEGDCSFDGGYSFETVYYNIHLDWKQALQLRDELNNFLNISLIGE